MAGKKCALSRHKLKKAARVVGKSETIFFGST
jgi:hypothetical protein